MKLRDIKNELRKVTNADMYKVNNIIDKCSYSSPALQLVLDTMAKQNVVKRLYEAYQSFLPIFDGLLWMPCGGVIADKPNKINYFCLLYPIANNIIGTACTGVIPKLTEVGFTDKGVTQLEHDNRLQTFEFDGEEYYVYNVSSNKACFDYKDFDEDAESVEMALILYRIYSGVTEELTEDFERLLTLSINVPNLKWVSFYGEKLFGMDLSDYLWVYHSLRKDLKRNNSKFKELAPASREKVFSLLDNIIDYGRTRLNNEYTVEENIKLLDKILKNDVVICDESALACWNLIHDKRYPVSVCTPTGEMFCSNKVYRTRFRDRAYDFIGCRKFSDESHVYIPSRERALLEYATAAENDSALLCEAVLNYLDYTMSLDMLYDTAEDLEIKAEIVDAMICTAINCAKVSELQRLA